LTFGGFYDSNLEFLRMEKVQIVASMNAATTVGRHTLSSRFTAVVRIGVVDYPDSNELVTIYDSFLEPVLNNYASGINDKFTMSASRQKLSGTMVEFYETVSLLRHYTDVIQKFEVIDFYFSSCRSKASSRWMIIATIYSRPVT